MNYIIIGIVACVLILVITYLVIPTTSASGGTSTSFSNDIWLNARSSSGTYMSVSTPGPECDYCACPINCNGTPRVIDSKCPPQIMECALQDCSPTPNCLRGSSTTSTYMPEPYQKIQVV